jgi:ribosomal-protein-alanine N-acetyltransferase
MSRADLDAVAALEAETFTMPWSRDTFSDLLDRPDAACVVAVAPGVGLAGYAVYWWAGGEAELGDLAVREPRRGRGIGSALVREVLEGAAARGVERMFLEVRESNRPARSLYRRHGFREAGRRPDYYRHPREDAIVMALSLYAAGDR